MGMCNPVNASPANALSVKERAIVRMSRETNFLSPKVYAIWSKRKKEAMRKKDNDRLYAIANPQEERIIIPNKAVVFVTLPEGIGLYFLQDVSYRKEDLLGR